MIGGRQPVRISVDELVRTTVPPEAIPVTFTPASERLDVLQWASARRDEILARLRREGAVLLRGFAPLKPPELASLMKIFADDILEYSYASTPRTRQSAGVYSATEYPADQRIPLHNEMSYSRSWPLRLAFLCVHPATGGGETSLADSRLIYQRMPADLNARFAEAGVLYVRNYGDDLDLPWQRVFGTAERAAVEEFCAGMGIEMEWKPGGGLRTRQRCQGVAQHPETGEWVWFNQAALFHVSALPAAVRDTLVGTRNEANLPRHCYYGDGRPIADPDIRRIQQVYSELEHPIAWQAGDVLLVDNMLVAHGRWSYRGARHVVISMGQRVSAP